MQRIESFRQKTKPKKKIEAKIAALREYEEEIEKQKLLILASRPFRNKLMR